MTIRLATIADLDLRVPLFDAYRVFYRKSSDPDLARRFLSERLRNNQSTIFLALRPDGTAAGFTQLFPTYSSAAAAPILILNDLFVEPDSRRQGVGGLLLDAAVGFGHETGAVRITLSTEVTNSAAQALYENQGWLRRTEFYVYNRALIFPQGNERDHERQGHLKERLL
jgi:GNAT superfamily N-acetyltransferase